MRPFRPSRAIRLRGLAVVGLAAMAAAVFSPAFAVGSDPGISQQWGLRQIGASTAWGRGVVGTGGTVAVIDTGIDAGHEDLRDQITAAVTCVNTRGDARRCTAGGGDIHGHGTHVSGIAAAASNSVGVAGVAPGARIVSMRVFQEEVDPVTGSKDYFATSSDINAAIRWVIANIPTKGSINLSLGGNFVVTTIDGAGFEVGIEEGWRAGWVPVLASGNENVLGVAGSSNYGTLNSLVVGATGPDDEVARYSSPFGDAKWGLAAPGGNARSSDPEKDSCEAQPERCILSTFNGGQYVRLQGTSMATPHVAGAAALLMGAGLSNAQTVQRLLDSANKGVSCGAGCKGRLDVAKATSGLGATGSAPAPGPAPAPAPQVAGGEAPAPSATSGSTGSTSVRRPAATRPGAAPPPTTTTGAPPAAPETSARVETPADAEPPIDEGLTGLSIESDADAVKDAEADDDRANWPITLAVLGVLGVGGVAALAWRRRWESS